MCMGGSGKSTSSRGKIGGKREKGGIMKGGGGKGFGMRPLKQCRCRKEEDRRK